MERLLEHPQTDVNAHNFQGLTALDHVITKLANRPDVQHSVCAMLQAAGCVRGDVIAGLFYAADAGDTMQCIAIIEAGCDANVLGPEGDTILTRAVRRGQPADTIRSLAALAAVDPEDLNASGLNPLHCCAQLGAEQAATVLIQFIDPMATTADGRTALLLASQRLCHNAILPHAC